MSALGDASLDQHSVRFCYLAAAIVHVYAILCQLVAPQDPLLQITLLPRLIHRGALPPHHSLLAPLFLFGLFHCMVGSTIGDGEVSASNK